jgi:hypothetical protein
MYKQCHIEEQNGMQKQMLALLGKSLLMFLMQLEIKYKS